MFGALGDMNPQKIRQSRICEFIKTKTQSRDNALFLRKYLDTNCSTYHQTFARYTDEMFMKLIVHLEIKELNEKEFLYNVGDISDHFYFVLTGKMSQRTGEDLKLSKTHHESAIFGYTLYPKDPRTDAGVCDQDGTKVVIFDRGQFEHIVTSTELSTSELKIEFLTRFVPVLRAFPKNLVEELEVFFFKEIVTKGFNIQTEGE